MRFRAKGSQGLWVPEVVQTSAMDCGPAVLKCLLEGFGISISYGRLREACQTDVDGTSIDTMEEVAVQLGLEAEQIMVPPDYVLLPEAEAMPAIVVVCLANGVTHFVVAWHRHGRFVQVMDPGTGRRWPSCEQFLSSLYVHTIRVAPATWREWATSEKFLTPLRRKLSDLGFSQDTIGGLVDAAVAQPGWRPLAALEAATRTLEAILASGGVRPGPEIERVMRHLLRKAHDEVDDEHQIIPPDVWSVRAAPPGPNGEEQVFFRGAVLVHVKGARRDERIPAKETPEQRTAPALSPELIAALEEPPTRPGRELLHLLHADGIVSPMAIAGALFLATIGVMVEALLFRSLLDMAQEFGLAGQRLAAMGTLLVFVTALLLLEFPITSGLLRIGRQLESRLRIAFLKKIPRLGDRYFHSRLNSDMAERSHSIHRIRLLPDLGGELLRSIFELILTAGGIIWLDPASAPFALVAAALALFLPLLAQPMLAERDMRLRNHGGALSRFYLDALRGLVPLRTHRAERALRHEYEKLLGKWARAGFGLQRLVVGVEAVQFFVGFGLAAWLLLDYASRVGESGGVLLLIYWALNLPALGQDVAQIAWRYPTLRNTTLRLLEPLGAPEEKETGVARPVSVSVPEAITDGVSISFHNVGVRVSGHIILKDVELSLEEGSHVAIVGPSGAGKSSLVGILLGWHQPASGCVLVDEALLDAARLERLRQETAWVDPAVQLWNQSLFDNLRYGAPAHCLPTAELMEEAELRELLRKLSEGLQTELGESGALVSGGEGQRVRLGRALLKPGVRLAILDEPFRGLAREQRRLLLSRARRHWQNATLLCVTHDVGETLTFPRVLVVEAGRIVEDGKPSDLARQTGSRYRSLLGAEEEVRAGLWSSGTWRRFRLESGRLMPSAAGVKA
jgi:ABC-type bacteriocin/lantibiotic exporter with double-glycine peptidase domain